MFKRSNFIKIIYDIKCIGIVFIRYYIKVLFKYKVINNESIFVVLLKVVICFSVVGVEM